MITLQESPVEQLQDSYITKYCHLMCCHPTISLCGAYKPKRCDIYFLTNPSDLYDDCPICGRATCPDCIKLALSACPYCEEENYGTE